MSDGSASDQSGRKIGGWDPPYYWNHEHDNGLFPAPPPGKYTHHVPYYPSPPSQPVAQGSPSPRPLPLPPHDGWLAAIDKATGWTYFYCPETLEVTWGRIPGQWKEQSIQGQERSSNSTRKMVTDKVLGKDSPASPAWKKHKEGRNVQAPMAQEKLPKITKNKPKESEKSQKRRLPKISKNKPKESDKSQKRRTTFESTEDQGSHWKNSASNQGQSDTTVQLPAKENVAVVKQGELHQGNQDKLSVGIPDRHQNASRSYRKRVFKQCKSEHLMGGVKLQVKRSRANPNKVAEPANIPYSTVQQNWNERVKKLVVTYGGHCSEHYNVLHTCLDTSGLMPVTDKVVRKGNPKRLQIITEAEPQHRSSPKMQTEYCSMKIKHLVVRYGENHVKCYDIVADRLLGSVHVIVAEENTSDTSTLPLEFGVTHSLAFVVGRVTDSIVQTLGVFPGTSDILVNQKSYESTALVKFSRNVIIPTLWKLQLRSEMDHTVPMLFGALIMICEYLRYAACSCLKDQDIAVTTFVRGVAIQVLEQMCPSKPFLTLKFMNALDSFVDGDDFHVIMASAAL